MLRLGFVRSKYYYVLLSLCIHYLDVQNCTRGPLQVLYFRLWPVSTVAQQPETQLSTWIKYGFDYYINLRSEREMRVGSGNFVTRRINFVINRILLEPILSPTVSGISLVILMVLSLSVFLTMSFKTIQFVILTSLTNLYL